MSRIEALLVLAALAAAASACASAAREPVQIEVRGLDVDGIELGPPEVLPPAAALRIARRGPARHVLVVDRAAAPITVRAAGACDVVLDARALDPARPLLERFVRLRPLVAVEGERAQIGSGGVFEVRLVPGCDEAERAQIEWTLEGGDPVEGLEITEGGRRVRGRMPALDFAHDEPGIIPISPRTRGTRRLRVAVTTPDGRAWSRTVELHAAARASGVPSIAVGTRTYLRGEGLEIAAAPPTSRAALQSIDARTSAFVPDARGRYAFRTADGSTFTIFAASHAATDLDCGRAECHAASSAHAARSPMTSIFARSLADPGYDVGCAIACHAVGEPGVDDGGMLAVARELGTVLPAHGEPDAYERLPRELRRLAGVGCTACHGPGAIPEPGARDRIVRTDVCAVCHDAPPRYGHVVAWRSTRMGTPDRDPALTAPACARCHDTAGFLGIATARSTPYAEIGCAACHAPHAADSGPSLLRRIEPAPGVGPTLAASRSRLCSRCHVPDPALSLPTASAVALLQGTHAFGPGGVTMTLPAPHRALECLDCHASGRDGSLERGASHAFAAPAGTCARCHEARPEPPELRARIEALVARLGEPSRGRTTAGAPADDRARARWNLALVANDRGAWAHAGRTALEVLELARRLAGD